MDNDLISREDLKKAMKKAKKGHYAAFSDITLQGIYRVIDNAPTFCGNNPKWCENCVSKGKCASTRPQGKWVDNGIPDSCLVKCTICNFDTGSYNFNYCPNCGAEMNGGTE